MKGDTGITNEADSSNFYRDTEGAGRGPRKLTGEETVSMVSWLRMRVFVNNIRIMWREMKLIFFMFGFLIFLQVFMLFYIGEDLPEEFLFLPFFFMSLPMMRFDVQYYNMYRITLFYRSDMNYLYPAMFDKKALVNHNNLRYVTGHIICFFAYLSLIPVALPHTDYAFVEAGLILFCLLLLKMFLFMVLNLIETHKRRDKFTEIEDIFTTPLLILIMFFFILFDFYLCILLIPQSKTFTLLARSLSLSSSLTSSPKTVLNRTAGVE